MQNIDPVGNEDNRWMIDMARQLLHLQNLSNTLLNELIDLREEKSGVILRVVPGSQ